MQHLTAFLVLKVILFPQHDIADPDADPDAVPEYRGFEVQEASPGRPDANTEIGVAGFFYEVTIKVTTACPIGRGFGKKRLAGALQKSWQRLNRRSAANIVVYLALKTAQCSCQPFEAR